MTRAFLFFLALFQQFMPPGMCLCQALTARVTTEQSQPVVAEPESAGCSCCKKKQPRTEAPTELPASPSTPVPCCPGVHADADQAVLSTDPVDSIAVDAVAVAPAATPSEHRPTCPTLPALSPSGSPPLYVFLRTLRI